MVYNEKLAQRVRDNLHTDLPVEEKQMMGGLTFMVDGKMCVGIIRDNLMARIDPQEYESALTRIGCREMTFTGRPMKGFVFVGPQGTESDQDIKYWLARALFYNKQVKPSAKRKRK